MSNNFDKVFTKGTLVATLATPTDAVDPRVQIWAGTLSKEDWDRCPQHIYVCQFIDDNLYGQVIDTHSISYRGRTYFLVKILVAVEGHTKVCWLFANNLKTRKKAA